MMRESVRGVWRGTVVSMPKTYDEYYKPYFKKRYRKNLDRMIEMFGGKCVKCGSTDTLQFDHIDPKTKICNVSDLVTSSLDAAIEEAKKCQLLCQSCHTIKTASELGRTLARGTHGTLSAYRYCGPPKCDACLEANNEYARKWKFERGMGTGQPFKPRVEHGTNTAYMRCGPPKCDACKKAHREKCKMDRIKLAEKLRISGDPPVTKK